MKVWSPERVTGELFLSGGWHWCCRLPRDGTGAGGGMVAARGRGRPGAALLAWGGLAASRFAPPGNESGTRVSAGGGHRSRSHVPAHASLPPPLNLFTPITVLSRLLCISNVLIIGWLPFAVFLTLLLYILNEPFFYFFFFT